MQIIRIFLGFYVAAGWVSMSGQGAFSLQEAIAYGLEHNANIRIQHLDAADAENQILEFKSIGIPKLEGNVGYNYFLDIPTQILPDFLSPSVYGVLFAEGLLDQREIPVGGSVPVKFGKDHNVTASLDFSTMLFDFAWLEGLKAQRLFRDLQLKNVDAREFETRSAVTKAYLAILIADKNRDLLNNNIRNLESLKNETQAIYESGFAEKLDVDRLILSLDNLKTQQQNAGRLIDITKNLLKFQMGYPIEQDITVTDDLDALSQAVLVENVDLNAPINYDARPEYRTLELTEQLNEANMKVIKWGYLPTLRGNASYTQQLQRDKLFDGDESPWFPSSVVGVSMHVPIFDGLEKRAKYARAKIGRDRVAIQKSEFERAMRLEVQNTRIQYLNAQEAVASRKNTLTLAKNIYETTQIKYREGVGSSLELSQAESDVYTAQTNHINALYDLIVAKTDLEIALGNI